MNWNGCDDLIMPVHESSFFWYASPGNNVNGAPSTFTFSTDLPPNLVTYDSPSNWSAAIVEIFAPEISSVSKNDFIRVHGPHDVQVTVAFDDIRNAQEVCQAVNDALTNLSVTGVKFSVKTDQNILIEMEDGFSIQMSGRISLIMGFYQKYLNKSTTSAAKFDATRPFETFRVVSNIFKEPGGDLSPAPALWIHPKKSNERIYYKPDNFRYLKLSSWVNEMTFSCLDISGDATPIAKSPDPIYIVLHFVRNA